MSTPARQTAGDVQQTVEVARPRLLRGLLVMALASVPVVALGLLVRDAFPPVVDADRAVVAATTHLARTYEWVRVAADAGEYVLHPFVFRTLVVVIAVVLWRRRARYAAVWAVSTMLVGTLLGVLLKLVFARARPSIDDPIAVASGFSFPSGHALNAALGVSIVLVVSWRLLGRVDTPSRIGSAAVGLLVVLLTDLDRLLRGVHFPTDVLAGNVTAVVIVWASWATFGPVLRGRAQRETERAATERPSASAPADSGGSWRAGDLGQVAHDGPSTRSEGTT